MIYIKKGDMILDTMRRHKDTQSLSRTCGGDPIIMYKH